MRKDARFPGPAVALLAAIGVLLVCLPLVGIITDAPWSRVWSVVSAPSSLDAVRLSILIPLGAALAALLIGVPVGRLLASSFLGRSVVRAVVLLPVVLPPVVGGIALLAALGPDGLLGPLLARVGIELPGTTTSAIIAGAFVSFPLVVLAAESGFRSIDHRLIAAASSMGASRFYAFRRIALPAMRPQLVAAMTLAWARALGEFGATATFAGTVTGRTETLPLAIYAVKDADPGAALALSLLLVLVSAIVLVTSGRRLLDR